MTNSKGNIRFNIQQTAFTGGFLSFSYNSYSGFVQNQVDKPSMLLLNEHVASIGHTG